MPDRKCARCGKPLSSERAARRKRHCYRCEVTAKHEQKRRAHDRGVRGLYGLRPGDYQRLYDAQGGKCAIYRCPARGARKMLAVDHDHSLGLHNRKAVRGLTCSRHNQWIGEAGDDPLVFDAIAEYLRNPPAKKVLHE